MPKLTLLLGRRTMQTYDFKQESIVVGRDDGADVLIDNPSVSRRHAEIRLGDKGWVVEEPRERTIMKFWAINWRNFLTVYVDLSLRWRGRSTWIPGLSWISTGLPIREWVGWENIPTPRVHSGD